MEPPATHTEKYARGEPTPLVRSEVAVFCVFLNYSPHAGSTVFSFFFSDAAGDARSGSTQFDALCKDLCFILF